MSQRLLLQRGETAGHPKCYLSVPTQCPTLSALRGEVAPQLHDLKPLKCETLYLTYTCKSIESEHNDGRFDDSHVTHFSHTIKE